MSNYYFNRKTQIHQQARDEERHRRHVEFGPSGYTTTTSSTSVVRHNDRELGPSGFKSAYRSRRSGLDEVGGYNSRFTASTPSLRSGYLNSDLSDMKFSMRKITGSGSSSNTGSNDKLPPLPRSKQPESYTTRLEKRLKRNYEDVVTPPNLRRKPSIRDQIKQANVINIDSDYESPVVDTNIMVPSLSRRSSLERPSFLTSGIERSGSASSFQYRDPLKPRSSPTKDLLESTRRNSVTRLPRPEYSPRRELPPLPKPRVKHYPIPPPSYAEGMVALSRRMRNRSQSPAPNYAELGVSSRPEMVSIVLGRPTPSREMIRMSLCGPNGNNSRNI